MDAWTGEWGSRLRQQRVLVTGATGFVGGHLCDRLLELGAEVHGLARQAGMGDATSGWQPWSVDLRDREAVRQALHQIRPQIVYHLAGLVTARQDVALVLPMLEHNLLGTIHLLLAATEIGCDRLILAGSSEEPDITMPIPTSPYAAAKATASLYGQMFQKLYGVPVTIVKLFMTYGPRQEAAKLIPYTILSLLRGEPPHLSSGQRICDLLYIRDLVQGLLQVGIQPDLVGQTVHLGTGQGTPLREVVDRLVQISGTSVQPLFGAIPDRLGEHPQIADLQTTRQILDWEPQWTLSQGLTETVAWYRLQEDIAHGR
ncbi:NAD-dependent epimerase/dehydratase family protein [Leptolyngbya sp. 'hensonii']|uniref:NAD-dependent epimerase/dehydratase family protein n=1 Tax=Leptolyngbya sp. 'hensonii' TaxID=1922337 RepID=UPI0015C56CB4|nr:NAD-dependent epimerase/dehydratase family protein [Leptolyngbya sp. 'hensonii']